MNQSISLWQRTLRRPHSSLRDRKVSRTRATRRIFRPMPRRKTGTRRLLRRLAAGTTMKNKFRRYVTANHKEITGRLKGGAKKRTVGQVPSEEPIPQTPCKRRYLANIVDDAVQDGWVKVLETGHVTPHKLSSIGQTTGKTLARQEARYVPAVTEFDNGEEEIVSFPEWDKREADAFNRIPSVPPVGISIEDEVALLFKSKAPHPCGARISNYEAYVLELKMEEMFRRVLDRLKYESPAQHRLLLTYFAGVRRGQPFSKKTSNKVAAIVEKLRRWAGQK